MESRTKTENGHAKVEKRVRISSPPPSPKSEKRIQNRRQDFAKMYSKPVPLEIYPIPTFIPHNPLSVLRIVWTLLSHYFYPPNSHEKTYYGYWSSSTHSIHVTDPKDARALWEMGFFGKGSLSRSEPTWLDQERRRLGLVAFETSEERTERRRKEREMLKRERAKAEKLAVEEQRRKESEGVITTPTEFHSNNTPVFSVKAAWKEREEAVKANGGLTQSEAPLEIPPDVAEPDNQEHLQLSSEEAFFLCYSFGTLKVLGSDQKPLDTLSFFQLCRQYSYFPPLPSEKLSPDDPFLLHYVVYHHFRSLGWVVRDGIKFSVDYLLYERGPVFKHAAFAIVIVPSYTDAHWHQQNQQTITQRRKASRDWHWFHSINRVQSHVLKTLVLVYVDVPPPSKTQGDDIGAILRGYKVREFTISRWSANRSRD
jgi:tRNA-splicing endonuclease subunit Sen2